jgi:hypothetical protein
MRFSCLRLHLVVLSPNLQSGAAFGATLYRCLVPFLATQSDVDNTSIYLIMSLIFRGVQHGAARCLITK